MHWLPVIFLSTHTSIYYSIYAFEKCPVFEMATSPALYPGSRASPGPAAAARAAAARAAARRDRLLPRSGGRAPSSAVAPAVAVGWAPAVGRASAVTPAVAVPPIVAAAVTPAVAVPPMVVVAGVPGSAFRLTPRVRIAWQPGCCDADNDCLMPPCPTTFCRFIDPLRLH